MNEGEAERGATKEDLRAHGAAAKSRHWPRRRFLKVVAAAGAAGALGWLRCDRYPDSAMRLEHFSGPLPLVLAAVVETMLPPAADRSPATIEKHLIDIDQYLTGFDPLDLLQLAALLYAVEHGTLWHGHALGRFTAIPPSARAAALQSWQESSVSLCRLGHRSLKSLAYLAHYRSPAAFRAIGYEGPRAPGFSGTEASRELYDPLLAPPGMEPGFS
ncbi:MAG: twin-arginine translocation signal domain-containing protein [Candidatus Schekmanbacteria bacterium]|nr:twin-arginine translocation signal domain-containing protein [Candidatus Schekmanbacteria bacterium]